jgi:hypothetical protein
MKLYKILFKKIYIYKYSENPDVSLCSGIPQFAQAAPGPTWPNHPGHRIRHQQHFAGDHPSGVPLGAEIRRGLSRSTVIIMDKYNE